MKNNIQTQLMKETTPTKQYFETLSGDLYYIPFDSHVHLKEAYNRATQKLDSIVVVTGAVGSGKSNKSKGLCGTWENYYFNREYDLSKVHFSAESVGSTMDRFDNLTEAINFDEAIQGGNSSGGASKIGKMIRSKLITKRFKKHLIITTVDNPKELSDKIFERCIIWYHVYYKRDSKGKYNKGYFKSFSPEDAAKVYMDLKERKYKKVEDHPIFKANHYERRDQDFSNLWYSETDYDKKKAEETSELEKKAITLDPKHVYFWSKKRNEGISYSQMSKEFSIPATTLTTWGKKVDDVMNNISFD